MTVAELIALLRLQPQAAEVMVDQFGGLASIAHLDALPDDDAGTLVVLRAEYIPLHKEPRPPPDH